MGSRGRFLQVASAVRSRLRDQGRDQSIGRIRASGERSALRRLGAGSISVLLAVSVQFPLAAVMPAARAATLTVCATGCSYTTIQAAINAASPGDTITVAAGTYNESLTINKSLTLLGAQAGVEPVPAGRAGGESTISSGYPISIQASNVTLSGFEITGFRHAIAVPSAAFTAAGGTVSDILIDHNWIHSNGGAFNGGSAFYAEPGLLRNLTLSHNLMYVTAPSGQSALNVIGFSNGAGSSDANRAVYENVLIENNWIENGPRASYGFFAGASYYRVDGMIVRDNYFKSQASGAFINVGNVTGTVSLPARFTGNLVDGARGTLGIDGGVIAGNTFRAGAALNLWGTMWAIWKPSANLTIANNDFNDSISGRALLVDSYAGSPVDNAYFYGPPTIDATTIAVHANRFRNNAVTPPGTPPTNNKGWSIINGGLGALDASRNWWDSSAGAASRSLWSYPTSSNVTNPWIASYTDDPTQVAPTAWPLSTLGLGGPVGFWPIGIADGVPLGAPSTTEPGTNVTETFFLPDGSQAAAISLGDVTTGGETTVTPILPGVDGAPDPSGIFSIGSEPVYYEISTTALLAPDSKITICLAYPASFDASGTVPQLMHYVGGEWVNATTSVDKANRTVCGVVTSLSPLALGLLEATTTSLASDLNPSVVGDSVTFTAHAETTAPADVTSGSVDFYDGATYLGTGSVNPATGQATYSTSALAAGSHSIKAVYTGNTTYAVSESALLTQEVMVKTTTTTTVTPSTATPKVGERFTATASVDPSGATGTVTFNLYSGTACTGPTSDTTTATLSSGSAATDPGFTIGAVGDYRLEAIYAGDSTYDGSTSDCTTITAGKADQTISVTTNAPASAAFGTTFPVAATASSGLPVAITTSGVCTGSGTDSTTVTMTGGSGTCVVHYNQAGDGDYNAAPEVTEGTTAEQATGLAIQYTGDTYLAAGTTSATLRAQLTGPSACLVNQDVTFMWDANGDGTYETLIGTAGTGSGSSASFSWNSLTAGVYEIEVSVASGDCNGAVNTGTLVIAGTGDSSNGGGFYTLSGVGRMNFGYTVQVKTVNRVLVASGQLVWHVQGQVKFKGVVSAYTAACPSGTTAPTGTRCGYVTGKGNLYTWDVGTSTWILAKSGIGFQVTVADGGTSKAKNGSITLKPDWFRMIFPSETVAGETTGLTQIKGGNIVVK